MRCINLRFTYILTYLLNTRTRRTTLGDRSFPVAAARAWNALPDFVAAALPYCAEDLFFGFFLTPTTRVTV